MIKLDFYKCAGGPFLSSVNYVQKCDKRNTSEAVKEQIEIN